MGKFPYRRIFKNFFSLNLVQISNIIFPLIVLPYVVRVIGVEKFGLVSFVQAFMMYFVILSDYGFNLAGTREISVNREDPTKITEIFYSILLLKFILGIICMLLILILILTSDFFAKNWLLYLIGSGMLFGSVFFPHWLFQGLEKMELMPVINITLRSIQVILIFLIIKNEQDYILYLGIISFIQFIIGITGFAASAKYLKFKPVFPGIKPLVSLTKKGFSFFSASLGLNIFLNSNVIVLGLAASEYSAGIFAAADKIRLSLQGIISSFTNSVFPAASHNAKEAGQWYPKFIKSVLFFSLLLGFSAAAFLFFFAENVVILLLGPEFKESINLLKAFSVIIIIFSMGEVFGYLILLPFQYEKVFSRIILTSISLHIPLLFLMVKLFNTEGAVYSILITQILITTFSVLAVKRKELLKAR